MTELNETGHMPNRLRILTAMFLTKNLQCPASVEGDWVKVSVADTGVGIALDKQEDIFQAYEQSNGTIERLNNGTSRFIDEFLIRLCRWLIRVEIGVHFNVRETNVFEN